MQMKVAVVEYLGTESQVVGALTGTGDMQDQRITATVPGDAHALLHGSLGLDVQPEDLHLFDTAGGHSLRPRN